VSVELLDAMAQEILTLKERVAFLESREVCTAAHENVDECGYCQRDDLLEVLRTIATEASNYGSLLVCERLARAALISTSYQLASSE
jgi:hypothetical protein